jgi:glycosyltransferase involved in cell wall biosynthesis
LAVEEYILGSKPSLRIALFHNTPSGGAKRAIYEWTRRLVTNHHIDVYTLSNADHAFCDIRPFVEQHHVFEFTPHKLFASPLGRLNQLQRWRDLGELTAIGRRIADAINRGKYDVVFAHTCLYTFIPTFLQFVQVPAAYYLHEPFGRKFTRQIRRPYQKSDGWRNTLDRNDPLIKLYNHRLDRIQLRSLRQTTRLLANSEFTREYMKTTFGLEAPVCHYGVDHESFHPLSGINKEDFVLSVGELSPRKGFDFIVDSLGHIPAGERPRLRLVCNVVKLSERSYVEGLAAQYGVDLQVLTNLNSSELAVQYNKARLCVYAPVLEPFGLVPLESMSCGTPVVGVREGGVQESIVHRRTGLLVERNPVQFAAAVQHLLCNPSLASEYGRNGREYVLRNWTWDQAMATLEDHLISSATVL